MQKKKKKTYHVQHYEIIIIIIIIIIINHNYKDGYQHYVTAPAISGDACKLSSRPAKRCGDQRIILAT